MIVHDEGHYRESFTGFVSLASRRAINVGQVQSRVHRTDGERRSHKQKQQQQENVGTQTKWKLPVATDSKHHDNLSWISMTSDSLSLSFSLSLSLIFLFPSFCPILFFTGQTFNQFVERQSYLRLR